MEFPRRGMTDRLFSIQFVESNPFVYASGLVMGQWHHVREVSKETFCRAIVASTADTIGAHHASTPIIPHFAEPFLLERIKEPVYAKAMCILTARFVLAYADTRRRMQFVLFIAIVLIRIPFLKGDMMIHGFGLGLGCCCWLFLAMILGLGPALACSDFIARTSYVSRHPLYQVPSTNAHRQS